MPDPRPGGLRRLSRRTPADPSGEPPTRSAVRNAKLAALPLAYAGRRVTGVGRRAFGEPARAVELDIQARTAQHMFEVLGELKGCAAKFGQILALYELALPPDLGAPYREALSRLQDSAPAMLPRAVTDVMAAHLGPNWRRAFTEFETRACAAASVGQVHRARWHDGRRVAVKIMYPGAREAVRHDLEHLRRMAPLTSVLLPGADVRALNDALAACIHEELDYEREARTQRVFAAAYADDPDFAVPHVVHQQGDVLISEWVDGIPLQRLLVSGSPAERDRVGRLVLRFVVSSIVRTGLLYTDPHPGNFRVLRDGRLGVVDYGACSPVPADFPALVGDIADAVFNGGPDDLERALRQYGFVPPGGGFDAVAFSELVDPIRTLFRADTVRMTTPWLREQVLRITVLSLSNVSRQLTAPPALTPVGRTIAATAGVLCQLGAGGALRAEILTHLPEAADALDRAERGAGMRPRTPVERFGNSA
ncbi:MULTISPECIES: AarF/ABC1/UbiB kinase family protein [unclassified Nocardia]|uniref:ABC1 kinase family protein n=1 Tax=unclassified Nocardia TaxID=2637762 RepID=UPI00278BB354|nr:MULTISPECIES: AarF/ABC1/UbiB kinase family protein [unclassified Nocardia]